MSQKESSNTSNWLQRLVGEYGDSPSAQRATPADTAVLRLPAGCALATSIDTLVCGVHFPAETAPADIGHKALAVNLSDLAAMGAEPSTALLSLSAPAIDGPWLNQFAHGFKALAGRYKVRLLGGTLNDGPLAVTVAVYGHLPSHHALRRDNAAIGDRIFVTGALGDAGLARAVAGGEIPTAPQDRHRHYLEVRLSRPEPRIAVGVALRNLASSAIDVSDGLLADLSHVLTASHVGAIIDLTRLPLSEAMMSCTGLNEARHLALSAGDDYELCFTVPPDNLARLEIIRADLDCPIQQIGEIVRACGLRCFDEAGSWPATRLGYQHFT